MTDWVIEHIRSVYSTKPDSPFADTPQNRVFRHRLSKKWFGIIIADLSVQKLGLAEERNVDILNLKCDPMLTFSVVDNARIFRGYHMNKEHWISVLLDGSVSKEELRFLIEMSYDIVAQSTARRKKKEKP